MSTDDEGPPEDNAPDHPEVAAVPEPEQPAEPAKSPAPPSGRERFKEIHQRSMQRQEERAARFAGRWSQQRVPQRQMLPDQPDKPQDQSEAHIASPPPRSPVAKAGSATTVRSGIGGVRGRRHIILQGQNIYFSMLERAWKEGESLEAPDQASKNNSEEDTESLPKEPASPDELIDRFSKSIRSDASGAALVTESKSAPSEDAKELPHTDKAIELWYYQELSERDRCFVKAAAVLHGAPLREIAEATNELYEPLREQDEARNAQAGTSAQSSGASSSAGEHPSPPPPTSISEVLVRIYSLIQQEEQMRSGPSRSAAAEKSASSASSTAASRLPSIDSLLERTHSYTQRVNGATRLFWKDADSSGLSRFSLHLLRFLARETAMEGMFGSQLGQGFLDVIQQWPTKYKGERSWRSANALGAIWWYQDARTLLWRQANIWAKSQGKEGWEHAAALLDGAYQVECDAMGENARDTAKSSVLQLIDQWITITHGVEEERGEGYAAARAYALIGRKSPEIALKGLERLLCFPQDQAADEEPRYVPESLFTFGVLKCVDIARSGHVRKVLEHLAASAKRHSHWRSSSQARGDRKETANQRAVALDLIFTTFFILASCSLSGVDEHVSANYSLTKQLPLHPACPDRDGRDLLLAGVLSRAEEATWQDTLATLLCSAFMEKNYQSAFYLLRRWGEIVVKDESAHAAAFKERYAQFLVNVGQLILDWSRDRGAAQLPIFATYKHGLTLWQTDKRLRQPGFADLASEVLRHFLETSSTPLTHQNDVR